MEKVQYPLPNKNANLSHAVIGLPTMPEKFRRPHHHERVQAVERMRRAWEAERGALATVRRFNAIMSGKEYVWFWPKIAAAQPSIR
jgi:hypothetical protein